SASNQVCSNLSSSTTFLYYNCYNEAQNPSVLPLANGNVGVSYSLETNQTSNACPGAADNTSVRVGFSISSDGGVTYGAQKILGNNNCAYEQASDPACAV